MATLVETPSFSMPTARPGRAMTRCECAELPFEEVARHMREDGLTLGELARRTGCGQTCTACVGDLEAFLARHRG